MYKLLFHAIIFTIGSTMANATLLHVFSGDSIQSVVDLAEENDTVLIHNGIYLESVVFYGKDLTLASEFLLDADSSHIRETQIIGSPGRVDTLSALVLSYGESRSCRIVGLTLKGSGGTRLASDPTNGFGGSVYVYLAFPTFEHCIFTESDAEFGGALSIQGNWDCAATGCRITDCQFVDCNSIGTGGAIWARQCSLSVRRCTFEYDTTVSSCSGLTVTQACIVINSCSFAYNYAVSGGALRIASCMGVVINCLFESNGANGQDGYTDLFFDDSSVDVTRCHFRNNSTPNPAIRWGAGGVIARFTGNIIEGMVATLLSGTFLINDGRGEVSYNIFRDNTNISGGTVHGGANAQLRIHHNLFQGNRSLNPARASAISSFSTRIAIDSNIFTGNFGNTVSVNNEFAALNAVNNYWGHPSGPYHPILNPQGFGDSLLTDSTFFIPWLTEPPDTTFAEAADYRLPALTATWELIELFPNPFNSEFRIAIAGFTRDDFSLKLFNLTGREQAVLHRGPLTGGTVSFTAPPTLASGIYFVVAADKLHQSTRKAILLK